MMGDMVYKWREGSQIKLNPVVAGTELERLRVQQNGKLLQAHVVAAARARGSPLHDHFEWDDKQAAHHYRLDQAGELIRALVVTVEKQDASVTEPIRAFVSVQQDSGRSYTSIAHAMSDAELRNQLVEKAWQELQAWKKRYAELKEFTKLVAVIDAMSLKAG